MIRRLIFGTLILFIGIATVLTLLLGTEPGTRWLLGQATGLVPGTLSLERVEGTLLRGLTIHGVHYEDETVTARLQRLELRINANALFAARLAITRFDVHGLDLHTRPDPDAPPSEPFRMPERIALPLSIDLSPARFTELSLRAGEAQPVQIHEIVLAATIDRQSARIHTLTVDAEDFGADLSARADLAMPYPLDLALRWRARLPEPAAQGLAAQWADGQIELAGDLRRLGIRHQVNAPVALSGEGELRDLLDTPGWTLAHRWAPLAWHLPDGDALSLDAGELHTEGTVDDYRLRLDTAVAAPALPTQRLHLSGQGDSDGLSQLLLEIAGDAGRLTITGGAAWLPQPSWDLSVAARALDPGEWLPELPGSLDLDLASAGRLEDGNAVHGEVHLSRLEGRLAGYPVEAEGDITLRGHGLTTPGLRIGVDEARFSVSGDADWSPEPRWNLVLDGERLDPGLFHPELAGRLGLRARSEGRLDPDTGLDARVQLDRLDGRLRDQDVAARGSVQVVESTQVTIPGLEARLGANRLTVQGRLDPVSADLRYRIDAAGLETLWPGLRGRLNGDGQVAGEWQQPQLDMRLLGEDLGFENWSLATLRLQARGTLRPDNPLDVALDLHGISLDEEEIAERLGLRARGHADAHQVNLEATTREGRLDLRLEGRLSDLPAWDGRITRLDLTDTRLGDWRLSAPARLSADADNARLTPLCLVQTDARLCLEGGRAPADGAHALLELAGLPLARFQPWLPENTALDGVLSADGRLRFRDTLELDARVMAGEGRFHIEGADGERQTIPFRDVAVEASLRDEGIQASAGLSFMAQGQASAVLDARPEGDTYRLQGQARADLRELRWLEAAVPQLRDVGGRLYADLALAGTLETPDFHGELGLSDGHVLIPDAGLELKDLEVRASAQGLDRLTVEGRVDSGPGRLDLEGKLGLHPDGAPWADLRLRGERFQAVRLPEAEVLVSPDLALALAAREMRLTGTLHIPEANIELHELPAQAVSVSRDEVIVDAEPAEPPMRIHSQVNVRLGDRVRLSGFGLSARLVGEVAVEDSPERATRVEGEIRIEDGRYRAYGQNLTVERGVLIFQGPPDNPGLDVRAVRRVPAYDVTAGLAVGGTLQDPRSRVFSTPAMEDSEAMSYLLTGRPLSGASQSDANMLAAAIAAFGIEQGGMMARQIGQAVGLDEVTVDSEGDLDQSALMLGKHLSSRLYVRYSVGLFHRASSLMLRYALNRRLSLETQTSDEAQSMDLIYRHER